MKLLKSSKYIFLCIVVALVCLWNPIESKAAYRNGQEVFSMKWNRDDIKTKTIGDYEFTYYLSKDKKYCWIDYAKKISDKELSVLEFPKKIEGAKLVALGHILFSEDDEEFDNNMFWAHTRPIYGDDGYNQKNMVHGIKKVIIPNTVSYINSNAFCGFRELESINIPDKVKYIEDYTFYNCNHLKKINLPKDLIQLIPNAFSKCDVLSTITINKKSKNFSCSKGMLLSKNKKELIWVVPKVDKLSIPSGVKTIKNRAICECSVKSVYIPASVTKIEASSIQGTNINEITVSAKNKHYAKSGKCIYSKISKRLVVGIGLDGCLRIPKEVQILNGTASIAGANVDTMIIPRTVAKLESGWSVNENMSLKAVFFESPTPPSTAKMILPTYCKYYVPTGSMDAYKTWYKKAQQSEFVNIEEYDVTIY